MKKRLLPLMVMLAANTVFAESMTIETRGPGMTIASDNSTDWQLKRNGDQYLIQNIFGAMVRVDVFVDKYIKGTTNTPSDPVYTFCGNGQVIQVQPGTDVICDVSYPGNAVFIASPFVNGATGRFTIIY